MAWTVEYKKSTQKQLRKLDVQIADRILADMEHFVAQSDPRASASPLTGNWQGFWRFRLGDYRAICHIDEGKLIVLVVKVGHRKDIYD